jgi:hypothetical protein
MCDTRSCYYYQYELCGPAGKHGSIGPAFTSNRKFFTPYNPIYYQPFNTYIYPVQSYKFLRPGTIEYLRKKNEEKMKNNN